MAGFSWATAMPGRATSSRRASTAALRMAVGATRPPFDGACVSGKSNKASTRAEVRGRFTTRPAEVLICQFPRNGPSAREGWRHDADELAGGHGDRGPVRLGGHRDGPRRLGAPERQPAGDVLHALARRAVLGLLRPHGLDG